MIPSKDEGISIESTVTGERIAMEIDMANTAHIIETLTNLYTYPEQAVVREVATNARDSHIEAGQTRPIEITMPTRFNPFLTVKDWGVGLSRDDIAEIYSKYGASTKRDTNEQTGSLGFGCKAPLAYADQFTVVGVKDGIKTTISVGREEDGTASMTILSKEETTDHNGVEVIVPTKRYTEMDQYARKLFRYWPKGSVLVDGKEPETIDGIHVGDDILIVNGLSEDVIVMGGVPYPAEFETDLKDNDAFSIVAFVELGSLSFAASREVLRYTSETKRRIARVEEDFKAKVVETIQSTIDGSLTPLDAFRTSIKWRLILPKQELALSWKGTEIPAEFALEEGKKWTVSNMNSRTLDECSRYPALAAPVFMDAVIVRNYTADKFTAAHKKKLKKWSREKLQHYPSTFILAEELPEVKWIDPSRIVEWVTIKEIILPRKGYSGTARVSGSYDVYQNGYFNENVLAESLDTTVPILYVKVNDFGADSTRYGERVTSYRKIAVDIAVHDNSATQVVVLGANRVAKFRRDFPFAKSLGTRVAEIYSETAARISEEEFLRYKADHRYGNFSTIRRLDPSLIEDPELSKFVRVMKAPKKEEFFKTLMGFRDILYYVGVSDILTVNEWNDPFEPYPLASAFTRERLDNHDHIYLYLNVAYAANKPQGER